MTDQFVRHGVSRCLLCDFQNQFLYTSGKPVGATTRDDCVNCGFEAVQVLERIEIPSEDLDTLGVDLDPLEPLPEERPMMQWWFEDPTVPGGESA